MTSGLDNSRKVSAAAVPSRAEIGDLEAWSNDEFLTVFAFEVADRMRPGAELCDAEIVDA